jgi:hypothetical protein
MKVIVFQSLEVLFQEIDIQDHRKNGKDKIHSRDWNDRKKEGKQASSASFKDHAPKIRKIQGCQIAISTWQACHR